MATAITIGSDIIGTPNSAFAIDLLHDNQDKKRTETGISLDIPCNIQAYS